MKRSFNQTPIEPFTLQMTDFNAPKLYPLRIVDTRSKADQVAEENQNSRYTPTSAVDSATQLLTLFSLPRG